MPRPGENVRRKILQAVELRFGQESLTYYPRDSVDDLDVEANQRTQVGQVLGVIERYRTALEELVRGRYQYLGPSLPEHFTSRCLITATCCGDGIVVRYDARKLVGEDQRDVDIVVGAYSTKSIVEMVPVLSENSACIVRGEEQPDADLPGPTMTLSVKGPGEQRKDWMTITSRFVGRIPEEAGGKSAGSPEKIIDTTGVFEIGLQGEDIFEDPAKGPQRRRPFITRTPIKLKVGWLAFEVYGLYRAEQWLEECAASWAENDVLLTAARKNTRDAQYASIDPMFQARRYFAGLVEEFDHVLDAATEEEDLQRFLSENPVFLEPAFVRVWAKLPLGDRVTDFVFRRATGEYLLVELEHPAKKLFTTRGVRSAQLTQASDQVLDWRRYIEDNLTTVQRELGLDKITPNPKSLIVIGRSRDLEERNRRKLATLAGQCPNLRIITYDDLRAETVQRLENMAGPLERGAKGTDMYYPVSATVTLPGGGPKIRLAPADPESK